VFHRGAPVKPFRYWRDPLCLIACALYAVNRGWLRSHVGGAFFGGYFNDLLLLPAALPLALWVQRKLGARTHDQSPRWAEIALHLAVWSFTAEVLMPQLSRHATGDWRDLIAYGAGAIAAGCWWHGSPA
jgi:hypothetical protein